MGFMTHCPRKLGEPQTNSKEVLNLNNWGELGTDRNPTHLKADKRMLNGATKMWAHQPQREL